MTNRNSTLYCEPLLYQYSNYQSLQHIP